MDDHDPFPQALTRSCIQLLKPTDHFQAVFHLGPGLDTRRSDTLRQALCKPFLFCFVEGEATSDEEGPCDRCGLLAGADTDGAIGFALFDEVHKLGSEVADCGAEGGVDVESDFDVDESGETADLDVVVEVSHLEC